MFPLSPPSNTLCPPPPPYNILFILFNVYQLVLFPAKNLLALTLRNKTLLLQKFRGGTCPLCLPRLRPCLRSSECNFVYTFLIPVNRNSPSTETDSTQHSAMESLKISLSIITKGRKLSKQFRTSKRASASLHDIHK